MCGIVGYNGPRDTKGVLLEGLKKLEYRGYDSAGVAILDGAHFKRFRAKGKLHNLAERIQNETFNGKLGIAHTRWATHGVPSERNAHPHEVEGVNIVHNGIIENYQEIRESLLSKGIQLQSDTDSELVAHLVSQEVKKTRSLEKAVLNVIPQLQGAYAIALVWDGEPDALVAFKNGPPLIFGYSDTEIIVASDIQVIIPYTRNAIYLEDGEVLSVKGFSYTFFNKAAQKITKVTTHVDWNTELAEKQGFQHFMLKEIYEQPRTVAAALEPWLDRLNLKIHWPDPEARLSQLEKMDRLHIIGCGTSYYAGLVGEYLIEKMAEIPVDVEYASEFRYRQPVFAAGSVVLVVSQSGETADTLAALRLAKSRNIPVITICNVKHSTIDRESDLKLYMKSDTEVGVASTKAFTSTLAVFNALALFLARAKQRLTPEAEALKTQELLDLPSQIEKVLNHDKLFASASEKFKNLKGFLYIGRGVNFPIALEGALKLKEIAYMHAEGYAAGEMKHGPIALIEERMGVVVVAPHDDLYEKTVSNLEEVRARGGQIISIGTGENERLKSISQVYLGLPKVSWNLNPILATIPLQLMAYHVACALGHDVDQPRNLAKSVTVE